MTPAERQKLIEKILERIKILYPPQGPMVNEILRANTERKETK